MSPADSPTTWEERVERKLDDIHKALYGNGRLGMKVRLILVELGVIFILAYHGITIAGVKFKF